MKRTSKSIFCLLATAVSIAATGQEVATDKIQYKLTGRILMDGGMYLANENNFGNGTEFSDLRVGAKASYRQWDMKVEIGYVGSKVSIKDAFATYTAGKHILQVGQFYEPFTLDMLCSTFDLRFNQSPGAVLAMTNSRRLGAAYTYNTQHYYACGGFFTDSDISNMKNASQGYALDGRFVYRPVNGAGKLFHVGLAAVYRTPDGTMPDDDNADTFIYKSPGVSTIDNRNLIYAEVNEARHQVKLGAELLVYYGKFSLQSEYIRTQVKRRAGFADYRGQGGYTQCSWLLLGREYAYDEALACPARPVGRALELCGRFNVVDMNDRSAGVTGGAQKDFSLGLNYYINKHVGMKVNYSYVLPGSNIMSISNKNFSLFQARFQFIL